MHQTRLESFFQVPLSSRPDPTGIGFLHLPPSVTNRIYKYAGPFREIIDLNYSNLLIYPYRHYPDRLYTVRYRCVHVDSVIYPGYDATAVLGEEEYWEYGRLQGPDRVVKGVRVGKGVRDGKDIRAAIPTKCNSRFCLDGRSLLFVCRQISEEVLPFFYANNFFAVRQDAPYGLKRLSNIGIQGLQALRSLTITLGTEERFSYQGGLYKLPNPLPSKEWSSHVCLRAYGAALEHLARHITPNRCEIYLAFRVPTFSMLEEVLHPLLQLPVLKNCGLWACIANGEVKEIPLRCAPSQLRPVLKAPPLSSAQVEEAELMLGSAIHGLTPPRSMPGCFRYLELPAELRLRILGKVAWVQDPASGMFSDFVIIIDFSDLIIADGVQWRPREHPRGAWYGEPYGEPYRAHECSCSSGVIEEAGDCICHENPRKENPILRNISWEQVCTKEHCCGRCRPDPLAGLCFCSSMSNCTFSTSCICSPRRHALFSVSRQVREDAIATYYSRNHFYITPFYSPKFRTFFRSSTDSTYYWPQEALNGLSNIELSLYLSSVPFNALQHIRWLEWLLPTPIDNYLRPRTRAWYDYLDALDLMRNSMNIENLTFVLNMSAEGAGRDTYTYGHHLGDWRRERRIVLALRRLGSLKDCFIYLSQFSPDGDTRDCQEQLLEKIIMGEAYDSKTRGKPLNRIVDMTGCRGKGRLRRYY